MVTQQEKDQLIDEAVEALADAQESFEVIGINWAMIVGRAWRRAYDRKHPESADVHEEAENLAEELCDFVPDGTVLRHDEYRYPTVVVDVIAGRADASWFPPRGEDDER